MANVKISALPSATTSNDTDTLVVVQSGVTKKTTPLILLQNTQAELVAVNGLIDDILATPATPSLYTASGTLLNSGVAKARNFKFITDTDGTYNPLGNNHDMRFNSYFNDTGGFSTQVGAFGMKANATASNKLAVFNMYGTSTPSIEMIAVDTVESHTRKIRLNSDGIYLSTEFASGSFLMSFTSSGVTMTDSRPTVFGLEYVSNYSVALANNDRSITDTGTVKLLRQDSNTWTTGTRPTAVAGRHGFNTTTSKFEGYNGTDWVDLG